MGGNHRDLRVVIASRALLSLTIPAAITTGWIVALLAAPELGLIAYAGPFVGAVILRRVGQRFMVHARAAARSLSFCLLWQLPF